MDKLQVHSRRAEGGAHPVLLAGFGEEPDPPEAFIASARWVTRSTHVGRLIPYSQARPDPGATRSPSYRSSGRPSEESTRRAPCQQPKY
jgi:hypothetical protein